METENRNYGIDALRILLTFFVCILHILGRGGVLSSTENVPYMYNTFYSIETFAYCAVDGYALISGYAYSSNKLNAKRIIKLWFEVFFYSFVITLILNLFGIGPTVNFNELLKCCFPIINNKFWYMTAYFPLFFFMPLIKKGIDKLNNKDSKYLLITLFIIFSFFGIIKDNYTSSGYHFLWLLILFIIGTLIKKLCLFQKMSNLKLITIYFICILVSWLSIFVSDNGKLVGYISPTIVLSGIIILILFSRLKPNKKIIAFISPLTTGIYLFQCNDIVWSFLKKRFCFISNMNVILGIFVVLLLALIVFVIGGIVDYARGIIFNLLKIDKFSEWLSKKLSILLSKINNFIYKLIE